MRFFSSLFSTTPADKRAKIQHLRAIIANHQASIENVKANMARYRASKAPKHYEDSGKAQISQYRQLIKQCRADIERLKV